MEAKVAVVVVNFNAGSALAGCVRSLYAQGEAVVLTLVDNASTDGSADEVEGLFSARPDFQLLRNRDNRGFAAAVNQGVAATGAGAPYLLILNPDCTLQPGALRLMREALAGDARSGLAGPLVLGSDQRPARATLRRFPDPWRSLLTFSGLWRLGRHAAVFEGVEAAGELPGETCTAEAVSGACMLLKRSVFEALGGLDEGYGLHCEDLDLMYRLREGGWHALFVPSATVIHRQGVSSRSRPLWVHRQKHLGMQRFFLKFQAERYSPLLRWLVVAGIWLRYAATLPFAMVRR